MNDFHDQFILLSHILCLLIGALAGVLIGRMSHFPRREPVQPAYGVEPGTSYLRSMTTPSDMAMKFEGALTYNDFYDALSTMSQAQQRAVREQAGASASQALESLSMIFARIERMKEARK